MPAKSLQQLKLMRMVLAFKKGEIKSVPARVKKIASSMTIKQLEDFVKPSKKRLPKRVKKQR